MTLRAKFLRKFCIVNPNNPEEKITKFGTIVDSLETSIEEALKDGWKPYGSMNITPLKQNNLYSNTTYVFTQIMTKEICDISESLRPVSVAGV